MTKQLLRSHYAATFDYHLLFHLPGQVKTILAGTYKKPRPGQDVFAFAPELDDFIKIPYGDIVGQLKLKIKKSIV